MRVLGIDERAHLGIEYAKGGGAEEGCTGTQRRKLTTKEGVADKEEQKLGEHLYFRRNPITTHLFVHIPKIINDRVIKFGV